MSRIRLVVTGKVEQLALAPALRQLFPDADFSVASKDGGTTKELARPEGRPREHFLHFVDEMLAAGDVERTPGDRPFDHVLVVDDLELANAHQPDVVIEHMACAARSRLDELASSAAVPALPKGKDRQWRYLATDEGRRAYLRERCSFHLLAPMVESLFFGDKAEGRWPALSRAGIVRSPVFDPATTDIESFRTSDAEYLGYPGNATWTTGAARDAAWRARHPKHYLSFLCDPAGQKLRPYKEKEGGKAALETLDWRSVVAPAQHARLVRSLLVDVADMVGAPIPLWLAAGQQHPLTCLQPGGVLRNIS